MCSFFYRAFINFLIENGTPLSAFHLMGHSAGTHLAGGAGAAVIYGKVPRITGIAFYLSDIVFSSSSLKFYFFAGLDPGDGGWSLNDTDTRLDTSDADFVDIIHTNGGNFSQGQVAFDDPIGHIDFYVNGGHKQPGCSSPEWSKTFP